MAGFGRPQQNQNIKRQASTLEAKEAIRQSLDAYQQGDLENAKALLVKTIKSLKTNSFALGLLATIEKALGNNARAEQLFEKSVNINQNNPDFLHNYSSLLQEKNLERAVNLSNSAVAISPNNSTFLERNGYLQWKAGDTNKAIKATNKAIQLNPDLIHAHMNLGAMYKELGMFEQALASTIKSLELKPESPVAHMNLGSIYRELGMLNQALAYTLKSLELKPDNPAAQMNLCSIYYELGMFDQALTITLKNINTNPDHISHRKNLNAIIEHIKLSQENAKDVDEAYRILLKANNFSHKKLAPIFIQTFLHSFQEASKPSPIISTGNKALANLAADWRLKKSLTLFIIPNQDIEIFLTRLRKELLNIVANQGSLPEYLQPLSSALAMQCFLNEYVYERSPEEEELVNQLIKESSQNQDLFNQGLAIIACYMPIHRLSAEQSWIKDYSTSSEENKMLIATQMEEPKEEEEIKASLLSKSEISNVVSLSVQNMYEENPYPRYRHAEYTERSLATNASELIKLESTKHNLAFRDELSSDNSHPKVLIAGCGTGNQLIGASRYKNAEITAIDLSSSSLAYAIRKAREYGMDNVSFKKMDLLDVGDLKDTFDLIECGGVLHHMEDPSKGLTVLNSILKPGGYIKLGLYSETARESIVNARNQIIHSGFDSSSTNIRKFRQKVFANEFRELSSLPIYWHNFYSMSECRDLCFHVQEHRFTIPLLQETLATNRLTFCGFLLQDTIKKAYMKNYPSDTSMISLENWETFEKQNPLTFQNMYQFWARKSS